jgi:hypothetical protein
MSREAEAAKTGRDPVHGPTDAGKAGDQVERPLQPRVVGVDLIRSESFFGVVINLDKVAFRPFRKAELSHVGQRPADAWRLTRPPWPPWWNKWRCHSNGISASVKLPGVAAFTAATTRST